MSDDAEHFANKILDAVDIAMEMVLESDGKFTHNTITIPMPLTTGEEYELIVTFRKKGDA